jgi:hypothetical protein
VAVTIGSSSRPAYPNQLILSVTPTDLEESGRHQGGRLEKETRFWIAEARRVQPKVLRHCCGVLVAAKFEEMKTLRARLRGQ